MKIRELIEKFLEDHNNLGIRKDRVQIIFDCIKNNHCPVRTLGCSEYGGNGNASCANCSRFSIYGDCLQDLSRFDSWEKLKQDVREKMQEDEELDLPDNQ